MSLEPIHEAEPDDGASAARRLHVHGHLLARREVEHALATLEDRGGVTDAQRLVVEAMAHRIVESVLESPTKMLASEPPDPETRRAVMALFGSGEKA